MFNRKNQLTESKSSNKPNKKKKKRKKGKREEGKKEMSFKECTEGNHQFLVITDHEKPFGIAEVVRWCRICGAITIDLEEDGRLVRGALKEVTAPQISAALRLQLIEEELEEILGENLDK